MLGPFFFLAACHAMRCTMGDECELVARPMLWDSATPELLYNVAKFVLICGSGGKEVSFQKGG